MRYLAAILLVILVTSTAIAAPKFPLLTSRVVDTAHIISDDGRAKLENILKQEEDQTGNQVVVATVPNLSGYTIEDYGYQLGRHWGIGQKDKDNGVILLVALKEHRVRIEVGYGLESKLTDALNSNIIQTIILPQFRNGNFEGGIYNGTQAILTTLNGGTAPAVKPIYLPKTYSNNSSSHSGLYVIIMLVIFYLVLKFIVGGISYLLSKMIGRPTSKHFFSSSLVSGLLLGSGGGGGFGGGFSGGFSGGGGSFGGGGASGGW